MFRASRGDPGGARDRDRRGTPISHRETDPVDLEDVFAIREATVERLGGHAGWTVGAASADAMPIFAPLSRRGVVEGGAMPASHAPWRALEVEIAFRVGPMGGARGELEPAEVFDAAARAVEVVESRFADFETAAAPAKLADLQSHGALLIGAPVALADLDCDPVRPVARLAIAGADPIVTIAGNPAGDPRPLLRHLLRHAVRRGLPLRPGDRVTTGSTTGLTRIAPGTAFTASIDGLGGSEGENPV